MKQSTTKTTATAQTRVGDVEFSLSNATAMAEAAVDQAMEFTATKMGLEQTEAALDCLQRGDCRAYNYFSYCLAQQIAEWLGTWDESIKAVYLYECETADEYEHSEQVMYPRLINLLIWSARKTNALISILEALNRALAQQYAHLTGLRQLAHLLDAQVIDDDNVQSRTGYGALLSSVHYKPIRVWER